MGNELSADVDFPTFRAAAQSYDKLKQEGKSMEEIYKTLIVSKELNNSVEVAKKVRIMVIDDISSIALTICNCIKELGFTADYSLKASDAYQSLLASCDATLILLDIVMPEIDGIECLTHLRSYPQLSHIPIYMMTSMEDPLINDICFEHGAAGILTKPVEKDAIKSIFNHHKLCSYDLGQQAVRGIIFKPTTHGIANIHPFPDQHHKHVLEIGDRMLPFKLCTSEFGEFKCTKEITSDLIFFLFVPSLFLPNLHEIDGILYRIKAQTMHLQQAKVAMCCVSSDLPPALAMAKVKYGLKFPLLSDPSLEISQTLIGTFNYGVLLSSASAHGQHMVRNDNSSGSGGGGNGQFVHPQLRFYGPKVGIVLMNNKLEILNKWVPSCPGDDHYQRIVNGEDMTRFYPILDNFPKSLAEWCITTKQAHDAITTLGGTIVVIDDQNSVTSKVAVTKLEKLGYNVMQAVHVQKAHQQVLSLGKTCVGVVATVLLPGASGLDALALLKYDDRTRHIPVVVLTNVTGDSSSNEEEFLRRCLDHGAAAIMRKPFNEEEFIGIAVKNKIFG